MAASVAAQLITGIAPVLDTSAYADNDVLFNSVEIPNAMFASGRCGELISISGHDLSDQAIAMDLIFSKSELTLGTVNSAVTAANAAITAAGFLGHVRIATTDYIDLVNGQGFTKLLSPALMIEAAAGSKSIWMAGVTRGGTPTYAAAGLVFNFGIRRH